MRFSTDQEGINMRNLNLDKPSAMLKQILPLIEAEHIKFDDIRLYNIATMYLTGKTTHEEIENEIMNLNENLNGQEIDEANLFLEALHYFQIYGIGAMLEELNLEPVDINDMHDDYLVAVCTNTKCLINVINNSIKELKKHGY